MPHRAQASLQGHVAAVGARRRPCSAHPAPTIPAWYWYLQRRCAQQLDSVSSNSTMVTPGFISSTVGARGMSSRSCKALALSRIPVLVTWRRTRLNAAKHRGGLRLSQKADDQASPSESKQKSEQSGALDGKQQTTGVNDSEQSLRQLLGMRGASKETNKWRIRLQLMKPITWIPLVWGVGCGAAASGQYQWNDPQDIAKLLLCMILSGPVLAGFTQTLNDWFDREIDAVNEPYRPIPSGAISEGEVVAQIWALLFAGLGLAYGLDLWQGHQFPRVLAVALFGTFLAYIYSAPPLKLKKNGWLGNYALGASYISLPWWAGQSLFSDNPLDWKIIALTLLYSFAGLGIAVINDFKSIEGDRRLGLASLPVMYGVDTAKWLSVGLIDIFQALVAAYLALVGETGYALALVAMILPQVYLQWKIFLPDPMQNDVKYQGAAQPFLVFGILITALAIGHHGQL
jgi:chlorophyll synthase